MSWPKIPGLEAFWLSGLGLEFWAALDQTAVRGLVESLSGLYMYTIAGNIPLSKSLNDNLT